MLHSLIGLIMTQFPFAEAAFALTRKGARDRFAYSTASNHISNPALLARKIANRRDGRGRGSGK
ncbi:hypothetical protein [Sphingopyxis witflariensis]|uniref:Uncharacterized protein n=1 Tax=Sphingopyxis witflariensis TaxID=173675 RepID=A0A246JYG6_9SPHN|nr:hypothetical protein [Sphingopyxis witflariensis]OWQ98246.1 hypothetical protein CDQ91_06940 [Sphingopyxis witflariensis]